MNSTSVDMTRLPLDELATVSMQRLKGYETLERASKSTLYRERWKAAGIRPEEIGSYEDFTKIPFITSRDIRKATYEGPVEEVLCSDEIVHWFSTTGTTGMPKWIPYGQRDIDLFMQTRDRLYNLLYNFPVEEGLNALAIAASPPFAENGLAVLNLVRGELTHTHVGGVYLSLEMFLPKEERTWEDENVESESALKFALDIKPNVLIAFPGFAARLAEIIEETAPKMAQEEFSKHRSLRNLAAFLVTRVKKIRPKDLSRFRLGLFGGEPLDPYREALEKAYGMETFEMYLFTEFMPPAVECHAHDGMHLWMDICLPEIIPQSELDKESEDERYTPRAVPLWKAEQGMRGEYVLTTFGEAFPLIRYRLADLVEVVSTKPCRCGITHPRIKVLRRSDGTICLGAIRFSASQLEEKLLARTPHGQAQRWQLEMSREGYRPKAIIRLEPSGTIANRESFLKEIFERVHEIQILDDGIYEKLVAEPVLMLEERISDEGRPVTKSGRIVYEGEK